MRRVALALLATVLGCSPLSLPPFELDVSSNCNNVTIEPILTDIDDQDGPWTRVLAAAADAPGSDGAWLLAVATNGGGDPGLAIVHRDSNGEAVVVDELPTFLADADDLTLLPGPGHGEMWLVERATAMFRLRHYVLIDDVPAQNGISSNFGAPGGFPSGQLCLNDEGITVGCDTSEWFRALVFFEGLPYLLSMPPSSTDASVDLLVHALDSQLDLAGNAPQTLNFSPECDPSLPAEELAECEALKATMTHPTLAVIGIQNDTRPRTTSLALFRETATTAAGVEPPVVDVAFVVLGHDKLGRPAGNLVSEPTLVPPETPEGGVAIDPRAMYVLYDAGIFSTIVQKTTLSDEFIVLVQQLSSLPSEFLQLDEDLALGSIEDGQWRVFKLFPDAPEESQSLLFDPGSELLRVSAAGPGTFLLHERDAGPDLVRLRCTDQPSDSS